jgi:hypothetical protein
MELYGYVPSFQIIFDKTIDSIRAAEHASQEALRSSLQDILLNEAVLNLPESPQIGNVFRERIEEERKKLKTQILGLSQPLRKKMLAIIKLKDSELRDAQELPALAAMFEQPASSPGASR